MTKIKKPIAIYKWGSRWYVRMGKTLTHGPSLFRTLYHSLNPIRKMNTSQEIEIQKLKTQVKNLKEVLSDVQDHFKLCAKENKWSSPEPKFLVRIQRVLHS